MGYSKLLFVEPKINAEFMCAICLEILRNPLMLGTCKHIYCASCIEDLRKNGETFLCPMDGKPIAEKNAPKEPQRGFLNLLNALRRTCQFAEFGCKAKFSLGETKAHESCCASNPRFKKLCKENCGALLTKQEVATHKCTQFLGEQIVSLTERLKTTEALIYQTPLSTKWESEIVDHVINIIDAILKENEFFEILDGNAGQVQDIVAKSMREPFGGKWTCEIRTDYFPFPTKSFRSPVQVQFFYEGYSIKVTSPMSLPK